MKNKAYTLTLSIIFLGMLMLTAFNSMREFQNETSIELEKNLMIKRLNYKLENLMTGHEKLNKEISGRYWEANDSNIIIYDRMRDKRNKGLFKLDAEKAVQFQWLHTDDMNVVVNYKTKNLDLLRILPNDINYDYRWPSAKTAKIYNKIVVEPTEVNFNGYEVDVNLIGRNFISATPTVSADCTQPCDSVYLRVRVWDGNGLLAYEWSDSAVNAKSSDGATTIQIDSNSLKTNDIEVTVANVGSTGVLQIENKEKLYLIKTRVLIDLNTPKIMPTVEYDSNLFMVKSGDYTVSNR